MRKVEKVSSGDNVAVNLYSCFNVSHGARQTESNIDPTEGSSDRIFMVFYAPFIMLNLLYELNFYIVFIMKIRHTIMVIFYKRPIYSVQNNDTQCTLLCTKKL